LRIALSIIRSIFCCPSGFIFTCRICVHDPKIRAYTLPQCFSSIATLILRTLFSLLHSSFSVSARCPLKVKCCRRILIEPCMN
jgi:hypothetical protein